MKETYYQRALKYEGVPYRTEMMNMSGMDCSGLVNAATGQTERVWHTGMGKPPGNWEEVNTLGWWSNDNFMKSAKEGDLFLWHGHVAFYAGGERLFHARKPGTNVGFSNDLKIYWLREIGFPIVYRQIF